MQGPQKVLFSGNHCCPLIDLSSQLAQAAASVFWWEYQTKTIFSKLKMTSISNFDYLDQDLRLWKLSPGREGIRWTTSSPWCWSCSGSSGRNLWQRTDVIRNIIKHIYQSDLARTWFQVFSWRPESRVGKSRASILLNPLRSCHFIHHLKRDWLAHWCIFQLIIIINAPALLRRTLSN